jgi:hypothetical protein
MIGDLQRERVPGTRWFLQERRAYARFSERMLYGLALLVWLNLPIVWHLRGLDGVIGAWNVPLASLLCAGLAQGPAWLRRSSERRLAEWDSASISEATARRRS